MYVIFAAGLLWLGFIAHEDKSLNRHLGASQYPKGYFTMLAVQLLPLLVTGFVIADTYIICTRLATLVTVLVVYAMVSSKDGTFATWRYRFWSFFWIGVGIF